jgi:hypothetical protein
MKYPKISILLKKKVTYILKDSTNSNRYLWIKISTVLYHLLMFTYFFKISSQPLTVK